MLRGCAAAMIDDDGPVDGTFVEIHPRETLIPYSLPPMMIQRRWGREGTRAFNIADGIGDAAAEAVSTNIHFKL